MLKKAHYTIKVSYIGYETLTDTIQLDQTSELLDGKNFTKDFKLNYTTIEGNEVTVTAQAKGQMAAINKQLNAKSLVNIISSDRIRELPDANAAETVARVPGVSIQREGGEGNKVVVRGLSPKYNSVTVNGVKLASTDNENRSTDLSMISQYMLDGIEVTKAGTPDLDSDVLGGTVNFLLRKARPGFHYNVVGQGMHNGLKDEFKDTKLILDVSNRFFNDRIGVLGQIDLENRNRSSNELGTTYNLMGEQLDSVNTLTLESLNLNDIIRINDRENRLFVFDVNIPNGNISYSNLNSTIDKDITNYAISYTLPLNYRYMNTSMGVSSIKVLNESFKYEQKLFSRLSLDAVLAFSRSISDDSDYNFRFDEPFAYTETTNDQSIEAIQGIAKNDTTNMYFGRYDRSIDFSEESEKTFGVNIKYDFRLTNNISGNIKFGNKLRTKNVPMIVILSMQILVVLMPDPEARAALVDTLNVGHLMVHDQRIPLTCFHR